ncbi:MAG: glucose PTS transporter subunit IIA [Selenomonadaceae bacterium]|nr:glucose PTS transporter subunit IIA [Selenomonadaceae bacterium]
MAKDIQISSPLNGTLVPLNSINDPVFASGAMGRGVAVKNPKGQVFAPFDGEITVFFPTGHAIGLRSNDGIELLIHVGMDTVKMNGEGFTPKAEANQKVKRGQLLLEFDPEAIKKAGYETTTPVVVTNHDEFGDITVELDKQKIVVKAQAKDDTAAATSSSGAAAQDDDDSQYNGLPDEERVAKLIMKYVGGPDNVRAAEHCATRLRLIVNDKSKIQEKKIENIEGVKGQFFAAQQYQIICGTGFVDKVTEEFIKLKPSLAGGGGKEAAYEQMSLVQKISRTLGDVFVPIIPVLVATGLFMGVRGTITSLGSELDPNFLLMTQVLTDTAFAFLPALVCWSTMKKFGGTPVIGIVLGLMLVFPALPNAYVVGGAAGEIAEKGLTWIQAASMPEYAGKTPIPLDLGFVTIPLVGYQGSVLPALVLGIFAAKLQQSLKTIIPDMVDLIVTPFLTLTISMALGFLVVGPIMHGLEQVVFGAVQNFLEIPVIGGLIIGGLQQVIVIFGVHHVFSALEIYLLSTIQSDPFNAIITCATIAQGGAALAVSLKTRDPKKRALYISSTVPAFLGITEPAIFGINLRLMKPFVFGCCGGAVGGAISSFLGLAGTGMGITVLPGMLLYMNGQIVQYIIVNLIALAVGFGLTYTFFKVEE